MYRDGGGFTGASIPLALYGAQLILNWVWTPLFFGAHKVKFALYELVCLWVVVALCVISFYQINPTAGLLMVPYQAWLSLAMALNYSIWVKNGDEPEVKKE